jgi:hypothetical protein
MVIVRNRISLSQIEERRTVKLKEKEGSLASICIVVLQS